MLLAVHISDGILTASWWLPGYLLAAALVWMASLRLRDEEIPRIALLTAAFFIASSIHVRVGPTSVHLLLNGLVGVVLGVRAPLAVAVGLALQVALLNHGGYQTLGVNACILTLPALLSGVLFHALHRADSLRSSFGRALLMGGAALIWAYGAAYSIVLLGEAPFDAGDSLDWPLVHTLVLQPWLLAAGLAIAAAAVWCERRLENDPEFPLGFLVGLVSVLTTVALNGVVLILGGEDVSPKAALVWVLLHLPVALIEGVVLGFTVGFLARVKPQLLGVAFSRRRPAKVEPMPLPGRKDVVERDLPLAQS